MRINNNNNNNNKRTTSGPYKKARADETAAIRKRTSNIAIVGQAPPLTVETIQKFSSEASFDMGQEILVLRYQQPPLVILSPDHSEIYGLFADDINTTIMIESSIQAFNPQYVRIRSVACSKCSNFSSTEIHQDWWCEHVVATLLTVIKSPDLIHSTQTMLQQLRQLPEEKKLDMLLALAIQSKDTFQFVQDEITKSPQQQQQQQTQLRLKPSSAIKAELSNKANNNNNNFFIVNLDHYTARLRDLIDDFCASCEIPTECDKVCASSLSTGRCTCSESNLREQCSPEPGPINDFFNHEIIPKMRLFAEDCPEGCMQLIYDLLLEMANTVEEEYHETNLLEVFDDAARDLASVWLEILHRCASLTPKDAAAAAATATANNLLSNDKRNHWLAAVRSLECAGMNGYLLADIAQFLKSGLTTDASSQKQQQQEDANMLENNNNNRNNSQCTMGVMPLAQQEQQQDMHMQQVVTLPAAALPKTTDIIFNAADFDISISWLLQQQQRRKQL